MGLQKDAGPQLDFYQKFVHKIILKYQVVPIIQLTILDWELIENTYYVSLNVRSSGPGDWIIPC